MGSCDFNNRMCVEGLDGENLYECSLCLIDIGEAVLKMQSYGAEGAWLNELPCRGELPTHQKHLYGLSLSEK